MKKILIAVAVVMIAAFAVPAFAATNPFMDVPVSHWAYDAVAQLASRGVISGYPDGSYKGAQPATRYEMASIVARAMAKIDMEKASKQDVEMLKKLIVEFKDELDALGVKVEGIDARLAVLEKDLGGWSLAGELRFDAKFGSDNDLNGWYGDDQRMVGKNEFDLNRYRIYLNKRIDENTSFTARIGVGDPDQTNSGSQVMIWERYYVTTKLPYGIALTVGNQDWDWEDELGLYQDNDAWFGDITMNMLRFQKTWGMADIDLIVGRNFDDGGLVIPGYGSTGIEQFSVAAKVGFDFNEKFMFGLMGYWFLTDEEAEFTSGGLTYKTDSDLYTYGVYAGYSFTPSIQLKGVYYMQDQGETVATVMSGALPGSAGYDDSANAWKAILDLNQDALKFTSLWVEYGQMDNNFVMNPFGGDNGRGVNPYAWMGAEILANRPLNTNTAKILGVRADQQWNEKWRSYGRYYKVDFDTEFLDDATNWSIGVAYRLSPAIEFELAYDKIDYGNGYTGAGSVGGEERAGDDNIVRFRTYVTF